MADHMTRSPATATVSVRMPGEMKRRVEGYATANDISVSEAARELIAAGLACDGLELYSSELGGFLRRTMEPLIEGFDQSLERRNEEQEDRLARVVHRATRASIIAAIAGCEVEKAVYPGLADVPVEDVYASYDRQAGMVQAGMTLGEARERVRGGKG